MLATELPDFPFNSCHGGLMSFKALLIGAIIFFIVMHLWQDKVFSVEISFFLASFFKTQSEILLPLHDYA